MSRNDELVKMTFTTPKFEIKNGFAPAFSTIQKAVNVEIQDNGFIKKRRGYNTFGEMVDVLWNINKQNKKMGFTAEYTVILPLKGTKPIYKKTLGRLHDR